MVDGTNAADARGKVDGAAPDAAAATKQDTQLTPMSVDAGAATRQHTHAVEPVPVIIELEDASVTSVTITVSGEEDGENNSSYNWVEDTRKEAEPLRVTVADIDANLRQMSEAGRALLAENAQQAERLEKDARRLRAAAKRRRRPSEHEGSS